METYYLGGTIAMFLWLSENHSGMETVYITDRFGCGGYVEREP